MKLTERIKSSVWDSFGFWKGRYKNFTIKIIEGGNGWSRNVDYYWVSFQSKKFEKGHNSLRDNEKFNSVEAAKDYAIEWVNKFIESK